MLKILAFLAIYVSAFWTSFAVDDYVFNGFELMVVSYIVGLLFGAVFYKRKALSNFSRDATASSMLFSKQSPLIYMSICAILVGTLALQTPIGKSFEVITYLNDKYERSSKGGRVYVIDIVHYNYGVARLRVSKEIWLELNEDTPILLKLKKNLLGLHVVKAFEPLDH
ncbi:hypothetical protein [Vibrio nigripulchritudo]|uniref:hypothetical protein n=1 Tax=Vibrio nigripulchritudo TaxID=28173 RepID=UPI0005FA86F3|nr:hypothetical protein [Vibrio nigripulchritudo]KJY80880.1 hypothetical protein TW74_00865 [Vibrio nigripulchritudo]